MPPLDDILAADATAGHVTLDDLLGMQQQAAGASWLPDPGFKVAPPASYQLAPPAPPLPGQPAPAGPSAASPEFLASLLGTPAAPPGPAPVPGAAPDAAPAGSLPPAQDAFLAQVDRQAASAADQVAGAGEDVAQATEGQADAAGDASVEARVRQLEAADAAEVEREAFEGARRRYAEADEKLRKFEFRDFWAGRSTGSAIMAAIGVAMGALGAAVTGGRNHALDILQHRRDQDFAEQKAQLDAYVDQQRLAGQDVETTRRSLNDMLTLKRAAANDAIAKRFEEMKLRTQSQQVRAQADAAALKFRQDADQLRAQLMQSAQREAAAAALEHSRQVAAEKRARIMAGAQRSPVVVVGPTGDPLRNPDGSLKTVPKGAKFLPPGPGEKAPTEAQAKNALLAKQIEGEIATIENLPPLTAKDLDTFQANESASTAAARTAESGIIGGAFARAGRGMGLIPKSKYEGLSPKKQQVANAWDNAIEKAARVLTGAGMPADEARRLTLQMAPHAGDSAAIQKQKLQRLREFAAEQLALAGSAAGISEKGAAAAKAAPAQQSAKAAYEDL